MHNHFFSKNTTGSFERSFGRGFIENFKKTAPDRYKAVEALPDPIKRGELMIKNMKAHGVDQVLPMAFAFDVDGAFQVHHAFPKSFPGVIPFLNPELHTDPGVLAEWKKRGAVGVKLYPGTWKNTQVSDSSLGQYFKAIREHELVLVFHFGVVKGASDDNWPISPMELRPWFANGALSDLPLVVAHFGAGYLREVLLMAYANKNLYVDTSGSNDWITWSPFKDLTQVFEKTISALGASRILFGTDSNIEMIRDDVVVRQLGILQDLIAKKVITEKDRNLILENNTRELFKLQPVGL